MPSPPEHEEEPGTARDGTAFATWLAFAGLSESQDARDMWGRLTRHQRESWCRAADTAILEAQAQRYTPVLAAYERAGTGTVTAGEVVRWFREQAGAAGGDPGGALSFRVPAVIACDPRGHSPSCKFPYGGVASAVCPGDHRA